MAESTETLSFKEFQLKMVAQRRSLLDYLSKTEADRYKKLIDKLNLRK